MTITAAYGSWRSPIGANSLVEESLVASQVTVDSANVYWSSSSTVQTESQGTSVPRLIVRGRSRMSTAEGPSRYTRGRSTFRTSKTNGSIAGIDRAGFDQ
jgi:hypothetical protein